MKNKINLYLVEFAINALLRAKRKNIFIFIVLTLLTILLTSTFLITSSIKNELQTTVDTLPQIIVQKIKAGRHYDIDSTIADEIVTIAGVEQANPRVWGYYYFANAGVNFSIVGIDQYEEQYTHSLSKVIEKFDFDKMNIEHSMVVGKGVKKVLEQNYYSDYFNFIKPDGSFKKIYLAGIFDGDTQLESNDMILMSKDDVREIFDISNEKTTDIVVKVNNPSEIATIASKIKLMYPDTRVITNNDLKVSYQNIFDYKSGVFLALFVVALFTFFMIIYDKASGLSSEEKKEIGILKAVGWRVDDVLKEKFYEAFIISFFAYILGVLIAFGYVYGLQAPLLRDIFVGYSQLKTTFELPFIFDIQILFLVFLLSVPIYIGATIIPSWRASVLEVDEVIR
ncbi:MAG TPA: ABC transporter permease [Campylobacterales bacterium]|nr:ABC transporter permease [Campylobacterales bacterium]HHH50753.1 ABC transporter permease [Campylobacterales bacterium]